MKNLLTLCLALCIIPALAQNSVVFKLQYKPNKVYKTTNSTTTETLMNFSGSPEQMDQMKAGGIQNPMSVTGSNEMVTTITTGNPNPDKTVPFKAVFGDATTTQNINGKEMKQKSPLTGVSFEGVYLDGYKMRIDTVLGDGVGAQVANQMKPVISGMMDKMSFPDKPMKVGDEFEQKVPMSIPLPGANGMQMAIVIKYKLKEISNGIAKFDIHQTITMDMQIKNQDITASGGGAGTVEFDVNNGVLTKLDSDLTMNMDFATQGMKINAKMLVKTKQSTSFQ